MEVAGMQHGRCHALERDRVMDIVGDDSVSMTVVGRMTQDRSKVGQRCSFKLDGVLRRIEVDDRCAGGILIENEGIGAG